MAASVHLKIKRCIQHTAVNYLRCFCKKVLVRRLTVQNASLEKKKAFTGVDKFPSTPPTFWGTQKMGDQNQSARPIETQLEIFLFVLYYLNRTYILTLFPSKVFAMRLLSSQSSRNA